MPSHNNKIFPPNHPFKIIKALTIIKYVFAAAALISLAAPAVADSDTLEITIRYDAATLQTPEGIASLNETIRSDAHDACTYVRADSRIPRSNADCVESFLEDAKRVIAKKIAEKNTQPLSSASPKSS